MMKFGSRRGQTLLMFSLTTIVMFGALGLVVDIGWSFFRKQAAQAAAQSAALAAAAAAVQSSGGAISCGVLSVVCQDETACPNPAPTTLTANTDKGCVYARENGFVNTGRQKVTIAAGISTPPTVAGASPKYWVTVKVSESIPQFFSAVLGNPFLSITARSTVGYFPPALGGCIYLLNATDQDLQMNGNIVFQTGCGVNINSDYYAALKLVGSASLVGTGSAKINIVGGYTLETNATISPTPVTGVAHFNDPMADVPPPNVGSCTSTGISLANNQTQTIDPGVYCGGITVTGHAVLTMNPGLYIITSGGLSVGGQATLNGSGVTTYVKSGSVGLAGGATTNITAPTSGEWQGILFYQDRSNTSAASLVGGSGQLMTGVLYFPTTHMDYTGGNSTTAQQVTIISDTLNITGNSYVTSSGNSPFLTLFSGVGVLE
jgi:Flp pilus assembly protein TadG